LFTDCSFSERKQYAISFRQFQAKWAYLLQHFKHGPSLHMLAYNLALATGKAWTAEIIQGYSTGNEYI